MFFNILRLSCELGFSFKKVLYYSGYSYATIELKENFKVIPVHRWVLFGTSRMQSRKKWQLHYITEIIFYSRTMKEMFYHIMLILYIKQIELREVNVG